MVKTTKLYINGDDAYATWGLRLDEGGLDALEAMKPMKEPVTNKNVTAQGAVIVCGIGLPDERSVSVPVHIVANSYSDFTDKRNRLIAVLSGNSTLSIVVKTEWKVRIKTKAPDWTPRNPHYLYITKTTEEVRFSSVMVYQACNQYTSAWEPQDKVYDPDTDTLIDKANTGYGIAKFVLAMYEPNTPTI